LITSGGCQEESLICCTFHGVFPPWDISKASGIVGVRLLRSMWL
jgi:hypothetical protein